MVRRLTPGGKADNFNECLTEFYQGCYDDLKYQDGTERFKRESRANRERSRRCDPDPRSAQGWRGGVFVSPVHLRLHYRCFEV
jgi:hypothetical protein